jgi:hypothetical protein
MIIEQGILRQPRAWLDLGGVGNVALLEVEVTQSGSSGASVFEGRIALGDPTSPNAEWWSTAAGTSANVIGDNGDGTGEQTLIVGTLDEINIDFAPRVVKFSGQSAGQLAAAQTRTDANFPNTPIMSLIQQYAAQVGLGVVAGAGTDGLSAMAGRTYDKSNYNFLTDMENVADAIQQLAQQAGVRAFVHGENLYLASPNGSGFGSDYLIAYEAPGVGEEYDQGNATKILCTARQPAGAATGTSQNVIDKSAYADTSAPTDAFGFAEPGTEGDDPALLGNGKLGTVGGGTQQQLPGTAVEPIPPPIVPSL